MSDSDSHSVPIANDDTVIAATQHWIERAVIGLNLCPFARVPFAQGRVRCRVSHAADTDALARDLCDELEYLQSSDPVECETTLLIHPWVLGDFDRFNDFLDVADALLCGLGLEGELQVASFHPDYQFADAESGAIENCTNRSPYPILHLLREASVERAVAMIDDPEAIYRRNIDTLNKLGFAGWNALFNDDAG